jgi:hypothetical protein
MISTTSCVNYFQSAKTSNHPMQLTATRNESWLQVISYLLMVSKLGVSSRS